MLSQQCPKQHAHYLHRIKKCLKKGISLRLISHKRVNKTSAELAFFLMIEVSNNLRMKRFYKSESSMKARRRLLSFIVFLLLPPFLFLSPPFPPVEIPFKCFEREERVKTRFPNPNFCACPQF